MSLPALSAIVVAPGGFAAVRTTVRHLAAQTAPDQMEVVLVAPSREALAADESALAAFGAWQVVEAGEIVSNAAAYAEGIRAAAAPVVALCEDHCYPEPGWCEALLRAHADDVAAVGPVVANASTDSAVAWADYLLGYGPWLAQSPGGDRDYLPGHNSSYKRDVLMRYDPGLERWLEAESVLHWDLRTRGERLVLEPAARTNHFNFSRARSWLAATFLTSRTFAGLRVRNAPLARRLLYAAASPLIPLIRLRRSVCDLRRSERQPPSVWRLGPALVLALVVSAIGEATGYAFGAGRAPRRVSRYEFFRDRHVNAADREAMANAAFWR